MKILISLSYYYPNISGLTIYAKNLSEEFVRRGHEVTVLTSQHRRNLPKKEVVNGVSVERVPYLFAFSKGFFMPRYVFYAFCLVRCADAVFICLPQFEGFIVALLAKLFRKRVCCAYVCEISLSLGGFSWFIEQLLHVANFVSMIIADNIITFTEDYARSTNLLRYVWGKTIYILPPVLSLQVHREEKVRLSKKLPRMPKHIIGFVGRFATEKGIEYLLQAIPILKKRVQKDFLILIAGPSDPVGEEKYRVNIELLLRKYRDYVSVLGVLPPQQMGAFYSLLDVLVLPSVNSTEVFGMVQVEAMLCGVPVVASDLPGVRVPITVTRMGELASVGDSYDLAHKIAKVLLHKRRYVKRRRFIEEQFALKSTIEAYEKLFTSLS